MSSVSVIRVVSKQRGLARVVSVLVMIAPPPTASTLTTLESLILIFGYRETNTLRNEYVLFCI